MHTAAAGDQDKPSVDQKYLARMSLKKGNEAFPE
jgi:hypothetical protein